MLHFSSLTLLLVLMYFESRFLTFVECKIRTDTNKKNRLKFIEQIQLSALLFPIFKITK